jgi:predicted dehydrogenase
MMKFLVVGGGSIGKRHIRNLRALGYTDIICLKRQFDEAFSQEMQVPVLVDRKEAIEWNPDVVVVCTPTSLHVDAIELAIACEAHIFMEKPLIHDYATLQQAIEKMAGYHKTFFIGFMLRFHPLIKEVKKYIESGKLGKVWGARFEFGSYLPYWHPWEDHRTGYAGRKNLGGGVINTITHELDLVLHLFGTPQRIRCTKMNLGKLDIDVEEVAEAQFMYADKLISLHVDYLQKDYDRNIKIWCDDGVIIWNWHENKILIKAHKGEVEEIPLLHFDVNQLYVDELRSFISLCEQSVVSHDLDFSYAVQNTKAMLAMHEDADRFLS